MEAGPEIQEAEGRKPQFVTHEVMEIRRFIDENIDSIGRDVLRRTLHRMLDRVNVASYDESSRHYELREKQSGVMADTAKRNVRLEKENAVLRECLKEICDGCVDERNDVNQGHCATCPVRSGIGRR